MKSLLRLAVIITGGLLSLGSAYAQCGAGVVIPNPFGRIPPFLCTAPTGAGTGTVTSVGLLGTSNQITVTGTSPITGNGSFTLSFPTAGVTLPGITTLTAGTTAHASLNVPSGVAPTTPASGDVWNLSGVLQYYDGSATQTVITDASSTTLTNKTINGANNTLTVRLANDVSGILPGANGGTANGFFAISGPATSLKTFTFPNASATVLTSNAAVTVPQGGTGLTSGTSGGILYFNATNTAASSALLASNALVIGGGAGAAPSTLGSTGTTTTVLHGGTPPSFGAVALATDVSGNLGVANLDSGTNADANHFWTGSAHWTIPTAAQITNSVDKTTANTYSGGGLQDMNAVDLRGPVHSADPGTCTAGQFEFNSTGAAFKGCTATNTWTAFATGGGTIGGSGTTNTIPLFSGATTIGNSNISQDGTTGQLILAKAEATPAPTPIAYAVSQNIDLATCNRCEVAALTGDIAITFLNPKAGEKFSVEYLQDGTGGRKVTSYTLAGGSVVNSCIISTSINVRTTQFFEVANGGTVIRGVGCVSDDTNFLLQGPERAAPGTPASGSFFFWSDSTSHLPSAKTNASSTVYTMLQNGVDINAATGQVTSTHITGGTNNTISKFNSTGNEVNAGLTDNGSTIATTELLDINGGNFKMPTAGGFTATSTNTFGFDSTNNNVHFWNSADVIVGAVSGAITNGHCPQFAVSTNKITIVDSGTTNCGGGASTPLSAVTAAAGANSINNGDNAQVWNWQLTTASKSAITFGENVAGTASGTAILVNIQTLASSTVNPLQVTAFGTANGIRVNTSGVLSAIGTGHVNADEFNGTASTGTNGNVMSWGASNTLADAGFLATNVVRKDASNTGSASMVLDMHSASATAGWLPPASAGAAPTTDGVVAYDSTLKAMVWGNGSITEQAIATVAKSNVTGVSANQNVTLATAPTAGHYHLKYYADQNATCSGGPSVSFQFGWTDGTNARTLNTGPLQLSSAQQTSGYLSGDFDIWVGSGNVTYTSTIAGTISTCTYDIHATLERGQ